MSDVLIGTKGGVMTIAFNRPEKKNAITDAMYGAVADALDAAAADDRVRAVVITGEGPDFTAGNDLSTFAAVAAGEADLRESNVGHFLAAISTCPKPIVAAVTGRAIGVGVTLLLHCDLVYLAADASLSTPFIDLGLVPEAGSSRLLPERIGHVRAFALFTLGQTLRGTEAAAIGLANAALPTDEVRPAAEAAAHALAAKPGASVITTKRLMRDAAAIGNAIRADDEAFLVQVSSPEAAAAFAAFAARRKPA